MNLTDYVILPGGDYKAACDAVREKSGKNESIRSGQLAAEIRGIAPKLQEKTVIPRGQTQRVEADALYDGLSAVTVSGMVLQQKRVSPGTEEQQILPEEGYDGLSEVAVAAMKLQKKTAAPAAAAREILADAGYDGLSSVTVDAMKLQKKTAVPSDAVQTITPDSGYDGLSMVEVAAKSGADVQIKTGYIYIDGTARNTLVGFQPDVVVIKGFTLTSADGVTGEVQMTYVFPEKTTANPPLMMAFSNEFFILMTEISQRTDGFRTEGFLLLDTNFEPVTITGYHRYQYTAIKYT